MNEVNEDLRKFHCGVRENEKELIAYTKSMSLRSLRHFDHKTDRSKVMVD